MFDLEGINSKFRRLWSLRIVPENISVRFEHSPMKTVGRNRKIHKKSTKNEKWPLWPWLWPCDLEVDIGSWPCQKIKAYRKHTGKTPDIVIRPWLDYLCFSINLTQISSKWGISPGLIGSHFYFPGVLLYSPQPAWACEGLGILNSILCSGVTSITMMQLWYCTIL